MQVGMAVEAKRPKDPASGWRWFCAYHLIKLAARFYPFKVEFFRTEEWQDRLEH